MLLKNRIWFLSIVLPTFIGASVELSVAQETVIQGQSAQTNTLDVATPSAALDEAPMIKTIEGEMSTAQDLPPVVANNIESQQIGRNLEQQFVKLQRSLEEENSFSEKLGEDYLDYGTLLRESGQYKEALDAFVDALHIAKVNNGIYSVEQRPALAALFETHLLLNNTAELEEYLQRILWVEKKNPGVDTTGSYNMQLLLANLYMDQFIGRPNGSDRSIKALLTARRHLSSAISTNSELAIDELLMPYGEIALVSVFGNTFSSKQNRVKSSAATFQRHNTFNNRDSSNTLAAYFSDSFQYGRTHLDHYLKKAYKEANQEHVARALLGLGDYYQLFRKHREAEDFYQTAWQEIQKLPADDELRSSFDKIIVLPSFHYASGRTAGTPGPNAVSIPLTLKISNAGRVEKVIDTPQLDEYKTYYSKARRDVRRRVFRPKMVDGQLAGNNEFEYAIDVYPKTSNK